MRFANDEEEVRGGKEGIKEAVLLMERTGKSVICQIGGEDEGSSGSEIHSFHFLQRALLLSVCHQTDLSKQHFLTPTIHPLVKQISPRHLATFICIC